MLSYGRLGGMLLERGFWATDTTLVPDWEEGICVSSFNICFTILRPDSDLVLTSRMLWFLVYEHLRSVDLMPESILVY